MDERKVRLWMAVNRYAIACGGDPLILAADVDTGRRLSLDVERAARELAGDGQPEEE